MILPWIGFVAFVGMVLALDLGVFNREAKQPSTREALTFTALTVFLALIFAAVVYLAYEHQVAGLGSRPDAIDGRINDGHTAVVKFITGYVVELSLSMDNVFVIALIFGHLGIPPRFQHRVLFWGILGALILRAIMIAAGTALLAKFAWIIYVFGAFLIFTGIKMVFKREEIGRAHV